MDKYQYNSQRFLDSVKRNLPDAEHSGPRSLEAKQKTRYNALKHGLNVKGILPCKSEACHYLPMCPMYNDNVMEADDFSNVCILEAGRYLQLKESFSSDTYKNVDIDLIEEYIVTFIMVERCNRCIAIDSDIAYHGRILKPYEYHAKLQNKLFKLSKTIIEILQFKSEENENVRN